MVLHRPDVAYHRDGDWWRAPGRDPLPAQAEAWRNGVLIGYFDVWPDMTGGNTSPEWASKGIDQAMTAVRTDHRSPVVQLHKCYPQSWVTDWSNSPARWSGEFGHCFSATQKRPGPYEEILAGTYDAQIDAWFNSIPVTERAYTIFENEPDQRAKNNDPELFRRACAYVINRGAPIYRARGLSGGIGTVFISWQYYNLVDDPQEMFDRWNYLEFVEPQNLPQTVFAVDAYSAWLDDSATTYTNVADKSDLIFEFARAAGCTRFAIPEFAIGREKDNSDQVVADRGDQQRYLEVEMPRICAIEGLEYACYFAKPDGPEAATGELRDDATGQPLTTFANMI